VSSARQFIYYNRQRTKNDAIPWFISFIHSSSRTKYYAGLVRRESSMDKCGGEATNALKMNHIESTLNPPISGGTIVAERDGKDKRSAAGEKWKD
jgi:hypothetical protein